MISSYSICAAQITVRFLCVPFALLLCLLAGCEDIKRDHSFIGGVAPSDWVKTETVTVRIQWHENADAAAAACDKIFQRLQGINCTYACALSTTPPTLHIEKPRGDNDWERDILKLIAEREFEDDHIYAIGVDGAIKPPRSIKGFSHWERRYVSVILHEGLLHGVGFRKGLAPEQHHNIMIHIDELYPRGILH